MGTPLTHAGFADLLSGFRESWFKFECQPAYVIGAEREAFGRFEQDGTLLPPSAFGWWRNWLDGVAQQARAGKVIQRVRVLDEPPTAYQRYLLAVSHWHQEAGENLGYLPRSRAVRLGLPMEDDWSLFDGTKVAVTRFTSAGLVAERELITDPAAVSRYSTWRDLALWQATRAEDIAAA